MNLRLLLPFFVLFGLQISAQKKELRPIIVKGYSDEDSIQNVPSSASQVDISTMQQQANGSLNFPFNQITGVSFEERGYGGSRRISIRGSALRSPFGVRNIKSYWNGMPITSPDGSTSLEVFHPNIINSIDVLKGTTSSFYGAGTGGTLLFNTDIYKASQAAITLEHGSFGLMGLNAEVHVVEKKNQFNVRLNYNQHNGYRDQESAKGKHALFQWNHPINDGQRIYLLGFLYEGSWDLPGAIDSLTAVNSPTTASEYAILNNTRVDRLRTQLGVGYELKKWSLKWNSILYGSLSNKINPYGTSAFYNGFKDEKQQGVGGRTEASYVYHLSPNLRVKSSIGAEFQTETNNFNEFDLLDGKADSLRNNFNIISQNALGFAQFSVIHVNGARLTVGGSLNQINYRFTDQLSTPVLDQSGQSNFNLLPSFKTTLSQQIKRNLVFANYSNGYSAPSVWEMNNEDGSYNTDLQPEQMNTVELGWKNNSSKKLYLQMVGYQSWLSNGVVATQLPSGYIEFSNGGKATMQGIELESTAKVFFNDRLYADFKTGYQYQQFKFKEYIKEGNDLSGKTFPGVPQHRVTSTLSFRYDQTIRLGIRHQFVDERFLNDQNTLVHPSYHLINAYSSVLFVKEKLIYLVRVGVNNLFDQRYSSFIQYNAFGGRYYNPSPGRNYYVRFSIAF